MRRQLTHFRKRFFSTGEVSSGGSGVGSSTLGGEAMDMLLTISFSVQDPTRERNTGCDVPGVGAAAMVVEDLQVEVQQSARCLSVGLIIESPPPRNSRAERKYTFNRARQHNFYLNILIRSF